MGIFESFVEAAAGLEEVWTISSLKLAVLSWEILPAASTLPTCKLDTSIAYVYFPGRAGNSPWEPRRALATGGKSILNCRLIIKKIAIQHFVSARQLN